MSRGNLHRRLERLEASARSGPSGRCPECGLRPQDNGYIVVDDNDPAGHNPGGVSGVRKKHQDSHPRGLRRRGGGGGYLMTKCSGITQAGTACKGIPIDGSQWCYVHHPDRIEKRRRHVHRGGRRGVVVHLWSSHGSRPASRTYQRRIWNFRTVSLSLSFNPKGHEPASAVDIGDRREHDGSPWTLLPNPSKAYAPSATRSTGASTAEPTRSSS